MKDIVLKITGRQFVGDEAEENLEFVTDGKMFERYGARFLLYEDSELSGYPGCRTILKLRGSELKLLRRNPDKKISSVMEFREGERISGALDTPAGLLDIEVYTRRVENGLSDDGGGTIRVTYDVSLGGRVEGHNELSVEVDSGGPAS